MNEIMWSEKKKNQGLSLIEVIVVVLIIGIASTIIVISISHAYASNSKRTAEKVSAKLDLTRTYAMSKVDGQVVLYLGKDSSGNGYIKIMEESILGGVVTQTLLEEEEICYHSVEFSYDDESGIDQPISNGNSIKIEYSKSSGAFTSSYVKLRFIGAKTTTIVLVHETGRNYIK